MTKKIDYSDAPYGAFSPSELQKIGICLSRILPYGWFGKRLGFALRKLVHGKTDTPLDMGVFGQDLRLYPYDNRCEKMAICMPQFFDPEELKILKSFALKNHPDDFVFFDLGSNVGLYSLFLAGLDHPKMKIVAVEADPYIYKRLRYNVHNNNLDKKILAHNVAVSDQNGTLTLYLNKKNRGENSMHSLKGTDQEIVEAQSYTLLTLMEETDVMKPHAIKLDLEGAEEPVLSRFFEEAPENRFPDLILIENAPERWKFDLFELIEERGYILHKETRMNKIYVLKSIQESLDF